MIETFIALCLQSNLIQIDNEKSAELLMFYYIILIFQASFAEAAARYCVNQAEVIRHLYTQLTTHTNTSDHTQPAGQTRQRWGLNLSHLILMD